MANVRCLFAWYLFTVPAFHLCSPKQAGSLPVVPSIQRCLPALHHGPQRSHHGLPGPCSTFQSPLTPHVFCCHYCHQLKLAEKPPASTACRPYVHRGGGGAFDWEAEIRWKSWGRGGLCQTVPHG